MNSFAYSDEEDKCYGLTGMVISLNIYDQFSVLRQISLDDEDESITFTPDFCFNGNPRLSAKIAWNEMLKQYQLLTGMVIGNIMCRSVARRHKSLTQSEVADLYALVESDGREMCSLEKDEIDTVFNKAYHYLSSVYANRQLVDIASRFAKELQKRRTMSYSEIEDELDHLRRN